MHIAHAFRQKCLAICKRCQSNNKTFTAFMKHFTQNLLAAALLALWLTPASAQYATAPSLRHAPQMAKKQAAPTPLRAMPNTSDYGTEVNIIEEDFSKMETGTPESPDRKTDINYENEDNAWINMLSDYTSTPGWGAHGGYPAGGALYVKKSGQFNTPMIDVSGYDGIFFVKFRARCSKLGYESTQTIIEAAETNGMTASWDYCGGMVLPTITSDWQEYEAMFYGGGKTTLVNFVTQDQAIVFDDVRVYQIDPYVNTPKGLGHRYYKGDNFNVRWTKSAKAEGYILNLYSVKGDGTTPQDYIVENQLVNDTTYDVTGADSGDTYYYTVTAVKGDKKSFESLPVEISDIAAPEPGSITVADNKYTASWQAVPTAERYNYIAYHTRSAADDGAYTVSDLNLQGMRLSDGSLSEKSTTNPTDSTYDSGYLDGLSQAGWKATHYYTYRDALCLDAWWYVQAKSDDGLTSPELDLSKDNGQVSIDLRLCGQGYEFTDDDNNTDIYYPHCAVAMFNYDHEKDDYVQTELSVINDVNNKWQDFNVKLTTGTEHSIVGIYGIYCPSNLYVGSVKMTQNYKAGDTLLDPFFFAHWVDGTQVEVDVPFKANGSDIYHAAQSVRVKEATQWYTTFTESKMGDLTLAATGITTGLCKAKATVAGAKVRIEGNSIVVSNPSHEAVTLFSADGATLAADRSMAESVSLAIPQHGTYIVKVGKQTIKVTL